LLLDFKFMILGDAKGKRVPFDRDFRPCELDGGIGFLTAIFLAGHCFKTIFLRETDHGYAPLWRERAALSVTDDYQRRAVMGVWCAFLSRKAS
jgi:hypothetical protein